MAEGPESRPNLPRISLESRPRSGSTVYIPRGSLYIKEWRPSAGWTFAFGARSGLETDIHSVRALRIELGALVAASEVALHISLNSQQFVPAGAFSYYGSPNVTELSPTTGPAAGGGPALKLTGGGRHSLGRLAGGSRYSCRFGAGAVVNATSSIGTDEVFCVAPAGVAAQPVQMSVSLNGQQYHVAPSAFSRLVDANLTDAASPLSGPVGGGTLVTIAAAGLGAGDDFRCRFSAARADTRGSVAAAESEGLVVPAMYHAANGSAVCASPAVPSAALAANATLQLAFNGLHYAPVAPFQYYEPPRVSAVLPASGPSQGGTLLRVLGSHLDLGSHAQCWLGEGRANATALSGSELRCVTPSVGRLGTHPLRVTLNGQQVVRGL